MYILHPQGFKMSTSTNSRASLLRPNMIMRRNESSAHNGTLTHNNETLPTSNTKKFIVRITNFQGCRHKGDIMGLILSIFDRKISFIHIGEHLDFCFVGLFSQDDADEMCRLFYRFAFNHMILDAKVV